MKPLLDTAWAVAEAVRTLNYATAPGRLREPSDVRDVLDGLSVAASRLPQTLSQLGSWLERDQARRAETPGHEGQRAAVSDALERAGQAAEALATALGAARDASGRLNAS